MSVASQCSTCFCVLQCVGFCKGYFVLVPLNLTYLHCLQHSFFEHLFNFNCLLHSHVPVKNYSFPTVNNSQYSPKTFSLCRDVLKSYLYQICFVNDVFCFTKLFRFLTIVEVIQNSFSCSFKISVDFALEHLKF